MALSKHELSEIEQLPQLLREKILRVFNSPLYDDWDSLDSFITGKWAELKEHGFPIVYKENGEEKVEKLVQLAMSARQEAETALKYAKELPSLRAECEKLRKELTADEQEMALSKKSSKSNTVAI